MREILSQSQAEFQNAQQMSLISLQNLKTLQEANLKGQIRLEETQQENIGKMEELNLDLQEVLVRRK